MPELPSMAEFIHPVDEAHPYEWKVLTPAQQTSARRVFQILQGILIREVQPVDPATGILDEILPPIRKDHWNNIILIDGKRGSGKTSVMTSILRWVTANLRHGGREGLGSPEKKDATLPDGIVPVAFLDLHPLPASTHLLLHLVGRLERVVRALEGAHSGRGVAEAPAWRQSAAKPLLSRERWNQLSEVASTAWDGNLVQRAASLDPEFYAGELMKVERHRLLLAETFRSFIDALWKDFADSTDVQAKLHKSTKDPLFLIAVDDADLVPHRSTEVLDLLRMLWHPRIVFLLTADSDQFLTVLRNEHMGILLRPLLSLPITDAQGIQEEAASRSLLLARSTLDKIIPPSHRCGIDSLSDREKRARLSRELKAMRVRLEGESGLKSLDYYFEKDPYAAKALPDQLRPLRDLGRELEGLARLGPKGLAEAIANLWRDLLQREPLLLGRERGLLREVVSLDEKEMLVVDSEAIECGFSGRRVREMTTPEGWSVAVMRSKALVVSLRNSPRALPESINGALKLATNLVADVADFHFFGESPAPNGFELAPVLIRRGETSDISLRRGFTWALPDWQGFLSTTLFADAWNSLALDESLASRLGEELSVSYLARLFLKMILNLAKNREVDELLKLTRLPNWDELAKQVADRAEHAESERERRIRSWAIGRAGLLAAPEGGLSSVEANAWLESLKKAFAPSSWNNVRERLAFERREQVKARWEGERPDFVVGDMLRKIDAKFSLFHWYQKIEAPSLIAAPRKPRANA